MRFGRDGKIVKNHDFSSIFLFQSQSRLPDWDLDTKIEGVERKMVYLGAQMELGAHLGHVSTYFEPYKLIGIEIKCIQAPSGEF